MLSSHFPHARPAVMWSDVFIIYFCVCVRMLEDCQDLTKDSVMNIKTGAMEQMPKSSFVFAGFPCDDVSTANCKRKDTV